MKIEATPFVFCCLIFTFSIIFLMLQSPIGATLDGVLVSVKCRDPILVPNPIKGGIDFASRI